MVRYRPFLWIVSIVLITLFVEGILLAGYVVISYHRKPSVYVPEFTPYRLYYNRIPKCASTTLISLLKDLRPLNKFTHISSPIYDQKYLDPQQQVSLQFN